MSSSISRFHGFHASRHELKGRRLTRPSLPVAVTLLVFGCILTQDAWTQDRRSTTSREPVTFNIPSQPLTEALQAYSQATGIELLYESDVAAGLQSAKLEGSYTTQLALVVLLNNTDLAVHYTRPDAVILSVPPPFELDLPPMHPLTDADLALDTLRVTDSAPRPDANRLREFSESVQSDIEAALRKDTRTKNGNYRASLELWVDTQRTVRRVQLAQSTGDTGRDLTIAEILQGLILKSGPPANTPQPVRVAIVVRSL